ncbi:metallophosphoesterase [Clostridioides difficile]
MSDLHGMYDKFISMLEQINFNSNDHLYILGDVLDRGDKSLEIILK